MEIYVTKIVPMELMNPPQKSVLSVEFTVILVLLLLIVPLVKMVIICLKGCVKLTVRQATMGATKNV